MEETDADGNVTTVTKSVLYVNVTLKSYRDMILFYGFNSDHVEMLEQIMSPEFMGQLGYAGRDVYKRQGLCLCRAFLNLRM